MLCSVCDIFSLKFLKFLKNFHFFFLALFYVMYVTIFTITDQVEKKNYLHEMIITINIGKNWINLAISNLEFQ